MFYNNSCTDSCKDVISCLNLLISGLIILGFSIYMFVISIIITLNINYIEQNLKPLEEEEEEKGQWWYRGKWYSSNPRPKMTTTSTRDVEFLGLTQDFITYEEAKKLKIVCIVFSVIIFFPSSLPSCFVVF